MYNNDWKMQFGSMANAYGQTFNGKGDITNPKHFECFLEEMQAIKDLAVRMQEDKKGVPAQDIEL